MTPEQRDNFARLLKPRHIAFIGGRDAAVAIGEARRIGYGGEYWPVNPKRETLEGIRCFSSVENLPHAPDAVFLAVPSGPAIEVVGKLRQMGAGGIVCYTAGFAESGVDGKEAEDALIKASGDMALIGPNCYGIINYLDRVALWPFAHGGNTPGYGCAIITQSGMLSSDLTMSQRSIPLTHMISIGNQAVLTMEDLIDVLCDDDRVRAIGLHIEGLKDIGQFAKAATRASSMGKPIVALKTGSSEIGTSLTSSHTGSLSGEDDLYDALFDRVGIIRVFSPSQLLETLKLVCVAGIPEGDRVAGFTCSGGGATMLADHAEKIDLCFPAHSKDTAEKLARLLPSIATVSNPLDYTTPIWGQPEITRPVFQQALVDDYDVAILVQDYPAEGLDEAKPSYIADAKAFSEATKEAGLPAIVCSTLPENLDMNTREYLIASGIAPMQGINETLDALAGMKKWRKIRTRILAHPPMNLFTVSVTVNHQAIDEADAKKMLKSAGITIPDSKVGNLDQIRDLSSGLGFPLVLKMVHRELLHKTEMGAVKLHLKNEQEVEQAAIQMSADVSARQPEASSDRFLLEEMQAPPLAELFVSIRRDAQFGLAMTIGCGGVLVELLDDAETILLPASRQDFLAMLDRLKITRLLRGYRGKPQADLVKLTDCFISLMEFMISNINRVSELEINPLFVYEEHTCAVDALIHTDNENWSTLN